MKKQKTAKPINAWALKCQGTIMSCYAAHTRRNVILAFEANIVQPPPQSSEPRLTIKDYPSYTPIRVVIREKK